MNKYRALDVYRGNINNKLRRHPLIMKNHKNIASCDKLIIGKRIENVSKVISGRHTPYYQDRGLAM